MEKDRTGTVLVVDDDTENIDILTALLEGEYDISVATDGEAALAFAGDRSPHLILLDIMMSGMDGYEVCKRLKQGAATRDIPVIFLSALADEADQETGLNLGAADYITKPYSPSLVRARVRNHVNLRRAQLETVKQFDALQDAYQKLREMEEQRDDLSHMLVHDLRTPLTSMLAGVNLCMIRLRDSENASPEMGLMLENVKNTGLKLNRMLTTLLDVSRLESGTMPLSVREARIGDIMQSALQSLQSLTKNHRISVHCDGAETVTADQDILERIIVNLLMNSLQHTPEGGEIELAAATEKNWVRITVTDTGPGIPPEFHEKIFQKFGRIATRDVERGSSAGLGLTFCKLAVEAHGGSIHVENVPDKGARLSIRLPRTAGVRDAVLPVGEALEGADSVRGRELIATTGITAFLISKDRMSLKSLMRYLETCTSWSITSFHDLGRAVRTALIVRPDIVLLDIDMQHSCDTDIFRELENVIAAKKSSIAYYTEKLLPEETEGAGYSLAKGGQPVISKRIPLAQLLDILVRLVLERDTWVQRRTNNPS